MNILHIAPEWKWSKIFISPIAIKQIQNGNDVWLSCSNPEVYKDNLFNGINIVAWNKKYKAILRHILSIFLLISMVRKFKINQVYTHTTLDSTLYILGLRLFTSVEIVYVNHGVPYLGYYGLLRWVLKISEVINVNLAHRVITITQSMEKLLSPLNYTHKTIKFLKPGTLVGVKKNYENYIELLFARKLKTDFSNQATAPLKIIYVGRIEKRKGIHDLITAVNQTSLYCELTILGGAANEVTIKFDEKKIKFEGFQTDLSHYYLNADLLCVPSHHEGFGQVYLEAASYGVIPICCKIPGPTDFIQHGINGLVVEPKSPLSILKLFEQIQNQKFNLSQLQKNAFESVNKYETSLVINNNMDFFK